VSVRKGQARLKKIADQIADDIQLSAQDKEFLVKALTKIYDGEDAEAALGVKAKKGERKSEYDRVTKFNKTLLWPLIKHATTPVNEGGEGMTAKAAIEEFTSNWGNLPSNKSLIRQWNDEKDNTEMLFDIKSD